MATLEGPPTVGRTLASGLVVFLAAIVTGRFLLKGDGLWAAFFLALPLMLLLLSLVVGLGRAVLLVVLFAAVALTVRFFIVDTRYGWILFLVVPACALAATVAVKTILAMRRGRQGPAA